ncbi:MAG: universal stress protein [Planctomycetaceae bacterium]|nr:universal stress protein [Planctomycetaceae bacterium]MCA9109595.1 universal stress protein [Planctomycetaceae bacterium]
MIKLRRILAASDFSECSDHALRYACEFAETFGAELHIVNVTEPPAAAYSEFGIGYVGVDKLNEDFQRGAEAKLNTVPSPEWQDKLKIVRRAILGSAFVELIQYAKKEGIDLIVMGTHGRGAIAHMLMGSTAEKVVRKAPCPVLTVRPEGHEFVMP